jgi:hypothetical protein
MFKHIWLSVSGEPAFPYDHLTALCSQKDPPYDPLSAGPLRHWIRGLAAIGGVFHQRRSEPRAPWCKQH